MLVNGVEVDEGNYKQSLNIQQQVNKQSEMETSAQTEIDPKKAMRQFDDDHSGMGESDFNVFFGQDDIAAGGANSSRAGRYDTYSEMDTMEFIHRGLELIADDSSQPNDDGNTTKVYSDDQAIKDVVENLLINKLDMNNELWSILYETIKNGDNFYEVIVDDYKKPKEIRRIRYLEPKKVERIEVNGKLSHFIYKTPRKDKSDRTKPEIQEYKLFPWQILHFKIEDKENAPYGGSLLKAGVRTYRRLVMLEDVMLVYRISRAPERRVFYIDVGNLNPVEAKRFLAKMKDSYRSQSFLDENGNINKKANVTSITSDIFVPVREGSSGTRIDTLPSGTAMGASGSDDPLLKYFKDKILKTMNIPPQYMGEASDKSRSLCLHPETLIKLTDGRDLSIEKITKEFNSGKENFVYSILNGEWVIKPIKRAEMTRRDAELVEVVLDNGESVKSTPDHRFMLRDGNYCEAKDLISGTSLMPIYTRLSSKKSKDKIDGYEMLLNNNTGEYEYTHRISVKEKLNEEFSKNINSKDRETTVHHSDFNKLNNNPPNLNCMTNKSHWELHQKLGKNLRDEKNIAKRNNSIKKFYSTEEGLRIGRINMDNARNSDNMKKWVRSDKHKELKRKQIAKQRKEGSIKFTEEIRQKISGKNNYQYRPELELSNMKRIALENNFKTATELKKYLNCGLSTIGRRIKEAGYSSFKDFINQPTNHKVTEVKFILERVDTYDITIDEETPNFALSCGIVVHNSQLDTKFGRFIERVQAQVGKGLNKLAALELFFKGYKKEDLHNFKIEMTPPSNVKEITEIDIFNQRMTLVGTIIGLDMFSKQWIQKKILKMSTKEIADNEMQKQLEAGMLQQGAGGVEPGAQGGGMGDDPTMSMGAEAGAEVDPNAPAVPDPNAAPEELAASAMVNVLGQDFMVENKEDFFRVVKAIEDDQLLEDTPMLPMFEAVANEIQKPLRVPKKASTNNILAQMSINELKGLDFKDRKFKLYESKTKRKMVKGITSEILVYEETEIKCGVKSYITE